MAPCVVPREIQIGGRTFYLQTQDDGAFTYYVSNETEKGCFIRGRGFCGLTASEWLAGERVFEVFADSSDALSAVASRLRFQPNEAAGFAMVESTDGTLGFVKGNFAVVVTGGSLGRLLAAELYDLQVRRKGVAPVLKRLEPTVLDPAECLAMSGLLSPAYLFDSIVTNDYENSVFKGAYFSRNRGFVDLNGDGHEDVLLSDSESQRGTGGLCYNVCLWTNGFYRCVGEVGGSGFRVERQSDGSAVIWSYWHSSCRTGCFCCSVLDSWGKFSEKGSIPVDWSDDFDHCFAKALEDAIRQYAVVPIRWEYSETTAGTNVWVATTGD